MLGGGRAVLRPTVFALLIIIAAYLPIFLLERVEGRIFAPMANTVVSALVGALRAALRRSPALMMHLASRVEIRGMTFDAEERSAQFNSAHVSFTAHFMPDPDDG